MTKNSVSIVMAAALLGSAAQVTLENDAVAQSSTTGALRGTIKDKGTGEALIGATVVATSTALQGEQVVITDEAGLYFIDNLPPGTYTLTVFYNDAKFSRGNVLIQLGKQAVVNVPVDTSSGAGGETIVIQGSAPIVDQGSTKTGATITKDFTENIPVGRTFGAVLGAAGGTQTDLYGASIAGSTSVESTYIVEGINTTDTAFGGIASNLPNEFVQETEVITGGYNAEFGRSTGGLINVVTKSGTNEFHGSVFGYFTPGALVAKSDKIIREGQAIDSERNLAYQYDVGAEVGGPIIKDKLWFHVGINPSQTKNNLDRIVNRLSDTNSDAIADIDPDTGFQVAEEIGRTRLKPEFTTIFYTAKINGAVGSNHQYQVSAWGNPRSFTDDYAGSLVSGTSRQMLKTDDGAYDASAKWSSKFGDGKTQVDAVAGFHRGYSKERPSGQGNTPILFWVYERDLEDFSQFDVVPEECGTVETDTDGDGMADTDFNQCPVLNYAIGGIGFVEQRTNDRLSANIAVTQRVKLGGYHTFKGGFEVEQTTYDSNRGFTGGAQYRQGSPINPASRTWRRRTYLEFADDGVVGCGPEGADGMPVALCSEVERIDANTKNLNLGAYLQDSWQIKPNLTVNAGIRWEQQTGYTAEFLQGQTSPTGETIPEVAFKLKNQWAPRIGIIYDPTQEGRSKVFGHLGRFYETMPMDINVRAFGGEILHSEVATVGLCPDVTGSFSPEEIANTCFLNDPDFERHIDQGFLGGGTEYVTPGTKGQYLDEAIVGAEYEFMPDFKMGLNYVYRNLPMVIEDMSADSANYYIIGNPGQNFDDVAAELHADALSQGLEACNDADPDNDPMTCPLALENEARSFNVSRIKFFDKPYRKYSALQVTANQRFSKNALLLASYTYSREKGNYPGLYSTETGQLDPNLTSMYDLQGLMANRYGPMGLDRPHNLKVDGFYVFDLKTSGVITLGGSFRAQSGLPQNTLAAHPQYGGLESYVLPRGVVSRTPATWQADIHASYGYRITKTMKVDVFTDIFNLFNNQETTDVDETYTLASMNPIVGGEQSDLVHAKGLDADTGEQLGTTAPKWKNFGNQQIHQAPLQVRFGLRLTF
jgi:hypothetical protein